MIDRLGLSPHPEGGHYRRTWEDPAGTAIYYLLSAGEWSTWHRVHGRAELWHFYAGAPLELATGGDGDAPGHESSVVVASDLAAGRVPQAAVPAGRWQRARTLGDWSLAGCTVAPPFTFDAFELLPEPGGRTPRGRESG